MQAPAIFYFILSASVIVIALAVSVMSIAIVFLSFEAIRVLRTVGKAAHDISHLKEDFQSGMIGSILSLGRNFFQRNLHNDKREST